MNPAATRVCPLSAVPGAAVGAFHAPAELRVPIPRRSPRNSAGAPFVSPVANPAPAPRSIRAPVFSLLTPAP